MRDCLRWSPLGVVTAVESTWVSEPVNCTSATTRLATVHRFTVRRKRREGCLFDVRRERGLYGQTPLKRNDIVKISASAEFVVLVSAPPRPPTLARGRGGSVFPFRRGRKTGMSSSTHVTRPTELKKPDGQEAHTWSHISGTCRERRWHAESKGNKLEKVWETEERQERSCSVPNHRYHCHAPARNRQPLEGQAWCRAGQCRGGTSWHPPH